MTGIQAIVHSALPGCLLLDCNTDRKRAMLFLLVPDTQRLQLFRLRLLRSLVHSGKL